MYLYMAVEHTGTPRYGIYLQDVILRICQSYQSDNYDGYLHLCHIIPHCGYHIESNNCGAAAFSVRESCAQVTCVICPLTNDKQRD